MIVALMAREAAADAKAAEAAFERGLQLMKQGKYELACAKFRVSLEEDFQYGALYVLAGCEEKRGHLATAWRMYQRLASEDLNMERRKRAARLAEEIEPRIPKLRIVVDPKPDGLVVVIDEEEVTAEIAGDLPVDLGERIVIVNAPGHVEWKKKVTIVDEAKVVKVEVRPRSKNEGQSEEPGGPENTRVERTWQYRAGQVGMIAGAGLTVTGLVFGGLALRRYDGAEARSTMGDRSAIDDASAAKRYGNLSTAFVGVGLVTAAVGGWLWFRGERTVTVSVDDRAATAVLSGRF